MTTFRLVDPSSPINIERTTSYLRQTEVFGAAQGDYPEHGKWLEKAEAELQTGDRYAVIAALGEVVIGAVVFRGEQDNPATVAIRNLSVHPGHRRHRIGTRILETYEAAATGIYQEATHTLVDTKATNHVMIHFLTQYGFTIAKEANLYHSSTPDVVLAKPLHSQDEVTVPPPFGDHSTR